jgi:RsiW-degrading membrane proteinase PrsW (M82 family)
MPDLPTILAALLLALVPSLLYLFVLNLIDRYEKEPWTILLACVGAGAVIAPALSIGALLLRGRPAALPPVFAPGPAPDALTAMIEAVAVGLVLVAIVRTVRQEFDDVLDGVIYGAAVGAGFGAAESFLYALGGTRQLDAITVGRLLIAGLNHAFYGAVIGAVLGWVRDAQAPRRWTATVLAIATAAWLQAFHDTLPLILANVLHKPDAAAGTAVRLLADAVNWLGIIAIAVIVLIAWRREARILRAELHDEVADGVVPEADFATVTSFRGRLRRQAALLRSGRLSAVMRLRRRYAAEGELAFHKWHLRRQGANRPDPARGDRLRELIRSLDDAAAEADG